MVSVQSPLTPPALALSDRAARALGETGHPADSQSTLLVQSVRSYDISKHAHKYFKEKKKKKKKGGPGIEIA